MLNHHDNVLTKRQISEVLDNVITHRPVERQLKEIFGFINGIVPKAEYIKPSVWAETKRIMTTDFSPIPGRFSFNNSPYWREVLDCLSPDDPTRKVAVMKGSQLGFSMVVLENIIGYTIDIYPRSMLYCSADKELTENAMQTRVDNMLQTTKLQDKIRPSVVKRSNKKTGDKKSMKEFAGGVLFAVGGNNANKLRQFGVPIALLDEVDAYPVELAGHGDPVELIEKRTDAYVKVRKILYGSTPLSEETTRIGALFLRGDQCYYMVPCPVCGEKQKLIWGEEKEGPGIKFERDSEGVLISESVHYQCINGCTFREHKKYKMLLDGKWVPTARPKEKGFRSFYISSLYSNFFTWDAAVHQFIKAAHDKKKLKVFINNVLGETFKEEVKAIDSNAILKNCRNYQPGKVPNRLSHRDGNGPIVMLVATVDVNKGIGNTDDSMGWFALEIKGFCENGQTYSIAKAEIHGKIAQGGNAWFALTDILDRVYKSDDNSIDYDINIALVDAGYKKDAVYWFCSHNPKYVPVRGRNRPHKTDRTVSKSKSAQGESWTIDTVYYKNNLAASALLMWAGNPIDQPNNFMNFPNNKLVGGFEDTEFEKKYGIRIAGAGYNKDYFKNYSAEYPEIQKVEGEEEGIVIGWKKRNSRAQNHFFDCAVYCFAALDIYCSVVADSYPDLKNASSHLILSYFADYTRDNEFQLLL